MKKILTLCALVGITNTFAIQSKMTDFNGDGLTDIAITGGPSWASTPTAFSDGNGGFQINNGVTGDFSSWSQAGIAITGDFNGDGKTDIILTGGPHWRSMPLALSNGDGNFTIKNLETPEFPEWATVGKVLKGDFNGDGKTDLALTGGPNWASTPVAFSNGNGTFNVTNRVTGEFSGLSQVSKAVAADFNGDGKTDIALIGGPGWESVPVAFSNGDGTFNVKNYFIPGFAEWAPLAREIITGDFNGDNKEDIALVGGVGWHSVPVAFSNGDGTFNVKNNYIPGFADWAQTDAKIITGDFNGDYKTDIALIGENGWRSIPLALSNGNGTFAIANQEVPEFPYWSTYTDVEIIVGYFDNDNKADILLTGVDGWHSMPLSLSNGDGTFRIKNTRLYNFPEWSAIAPYRLESSHISTFSR